MAPLPHWITSNNIIMNKLLFKIFDLELAKSGDTVVTRDGEVITLVYFDVPGLYPILGFKSCGMIMSFTKEGAYCINKEHKYDLFMAPKKVQACANVYRRHNDGYLFVGPVYPSMEIAKEFINDYDAEYYDAEYVKTILIHEEEI